MAAAALALVVAAACGGDGRTGNTSTEVRLSDAGNALVSRDTNPIIARNSPTIVVNPRDNENMVVVDRVDLPDYTAGVHISKDAGGSWQDVALGLPAGNKGKLFAPSAVYDAKGTLY
ncbi:MAG TPA: hypothetical protein VJ653_06770, partial [Acidimicrobiales bacterium]|nr:hypothetical protein [Acidimicrobiales bacterium]